MPPKTPSKARSGAPSKRPPGRPPAAPALSPEALLRAVMASLDDMQADDCVALDLRAADMPMDYMVVAGGRSARHVRAISKQLCEDLRRAGAPAPGVEDDGIGEWILLDCGDVVVHAMQDKTRRFYDLEGLWSGADAPQ